MGWLIDEQTPARKLLNQILGNGTKAPSEKKPAKSYPEQSKRQLERAKRYKNTPDSWTNLTQTHGLKSSKEL